MNHRRMLGLFLFFIAGFTLLQARLFVLMTENAQVAGTVVSQSVYQSIIAVHRPDFYDCNGRRLTGAQSVEYAVLYPEDPAAYNVLSYLDESGVGQFLTGMGGNTPFVVPLVSDPGDGSLDTVSVEQRYARPQAAAHLIGYLDFEGRGVSGLELAFEEYFAGNSTHTVLETQVNAQGTQVEGAEVRVYEDAYSAAGVRLSIDLRIQRQCELIADELIESGAVIVLDTETGEIRAMVSRPDFDPGDVAQSLDAENAPLLNKALAAYNVGSIYKPVLAACALSAGLSGFTYECTGSITVDGQSYSCNDGAAHGAVDMEQALVHSCNTYFIALGQQIGSEAVYNAACAISANRSIELWTGYSSASANMPTMQEFEEYGELCNHCFGQGKLLLTPLHVAAATNAIARGGNYIEPSLIEVVGGEAQPAGKRTDIFAQQAAESVAEYLKSVVAGGTGSNAQPSLTTAAGKTGTAQTGTYNEDGSERVIGWFTGWFPADEPKYTVVVMTEDAGYGFESAAPVFARIADELTRRNY